MKNSDYSWYLGIKSRLVHILKEEAPDLVLISGGPFYNFILTGKIKRMAASRVVLDLRDFWTIGNYDEPQKKSIKGKVSYFLNIFIEGWSFFRADLIIFNTNSMRSAYLNKYLFIKNKNIVLRNGFSLKKIEEAKSNIKKRNTNNHLRIICAGKFFYYYPEKVESFFNLLSEYSIKYKKPVEFIHIGETEEGAKKIACSLGIYYVEKGLMPYDKVLLEIGAADLCYAVSRSKNLIVVKILDYLGMEKKIILSGPKPEDLNDYKIDSMIASMDDMGPEELYRFINSKNKKESYNRVLKSFDRGEMVLGCYKKIIGK